MRNIESIRNTITNLIRFSEDSAATECEIEAAVRAATKLMAKYNITRCDIDRSDPEDSTKNVRLGRHVAVSHGAKLTTWEIELTSFVCDFLGFVLVCWETAVPLFKNGIAVVDANGKHRKGALIYFYGASDNAKAAVEMFEELRDIIAAMAVVHHGGWFRGDGAVYAQGFVAGMSEARKAGIKDLEGSNAETNAMVLQNEENQLKLAKRSKKWLVNKYGWQLQSSARRSGAIGDPEAFIQGQKHGRQHRPNRRRQNLRLNG